MKAYFHSLNPPELEGGRGRASGFIMRAMAENKLKHSGQYKNPTYPLAPESTMNKPIEFDWRKLANKNQGGVPVAGTKTYWGTKGDYGASPFILQHFSGSPKPFKKGDRKDYPKETDIQKKARLIFMAKKLLDKAKEATAPIVNPIPEAPKNEVVLTSPEAQEAPKDADPIPHFGNVSMGEPPVGLEIKPKKKFKVKRIIKEEAEPPKNEKVLDDSIVQPEPLPPVKERKKFKVKKVAETPTPPNPPPKIVWTEEELKTNPLTRKKYQYHYTDNEDGYSAKDEREMALFLYALNNPNAKLADAIKHLKDSGIGKGFSPSTISPLYKEARKDADKIIEEEEKQNKTLTNPAFTAIKDKFSSLLKDKAKKPRRTIVNAFKNIQANKYLDAYKQYVKELGKNPESHAIIDKEEHLRHSGGGDWVKYSKKSALADGKKWATGIDPTTEKLKDGEYKHKYGDATHWQNWEKELEVKDAKGEPVKVGKSLVIGGMWRDKGVWIVESNNIALYIPSNSFPNPAETPYQRIYNINEGNSGRFPKYDKGISKVFYVRDLWEHNEAINLGRQLNYWINTPYKGEDPERDRKYMIGTARNINKEAKQLEGREYDYITTVNGIEYICPKNTSSEDYYNLQPDKSPEERGRMEKPSEVLDIPSKGQWTLENSGEALGKESKEDEKNYFDSLSETEKKVALHYLNKGFGAWMNVPEIPEGRYRSSEIKSELEALVKRRSKEVKQYKKDKMEYEYSIAKSKKKSGGAYKLNVVSDADAKNPEEIKVLPIKNKVRYAKAKEALLEALSNSTVPPVASRANLLGTESGMMAGKKSGEGIVARGVAYGFGNNRRGFDYYVKNKQNPELYKALVAFGEAIVPKGWDFQTIQLNHNAKARKHRDKNNVGKSVIIGIGDYNGGELRVWDKDDNKHKDYNIKDRPTMFNGALLSHETQPFNNPTEYEPGKGRYTIVYFRHKYKPTKGNVGVGSGKHDIDTMEGKGMAQPSASVIEDHFV